MKYFSPIYLAGQTASGKTGVSIELARRLGSASVVSADAFQIYRGLEILTAAPSPREQSAVPHSMVSIFDIGEECDAARFARLAKDEITRISAAAVPIVVGGSGLYLKAITHGFAPTPPGDEDLREKMEKRTLAELVAKYEKLDPAGAATTNLKNRRYVIRNLEICLLTGKPASQIKDTWENAAPKFRGIFLRRDREDLYERINRRTKEMFREGVIREVEGLSGPISATAAKAIGLGEIQSLLAGEISESECIARIQQMTRRYAKRQETWFRRESQFRPVNCSPDATPAEIADQIFKIFPVSDVESKSDRASCQTLDQETQPESR